MAKFKFDVGVIIYYEMTVEADDAVTAKSILESGTADLRNGLGFSTTITDHNIVHNPQQKEVQWYGVKPNSMVKVIEEVIE